MDQLLYKKRVLSSELSSDFKVSEFTIRRDLNELAKEGKLLKVHGGALATSQHLYSFKEDDILDHDKKLIIAQKALSLIENNDVLIIGGGTTNLELINILPPELNVTVFTYSLPIALRLSEHPKVDVHIFGGRIMKSAQIVMSMEVLMNISKIRADRCFLGASGIDVSSGVTEIDWDVSQLKQSIIEVSDTVVVLSTSEKIDTKHRFIVGGLEKINMLVTEYDPDDPIFIEYRKRGLQLL
ncbi:MAG: DeoR/GlpR transcriptional regulator [Cyclobacteriaceae bacterium]|nr:DeoR/GlpR transcriptional regulator [Cyclobacteriaceae bacterium HetDA_MAG_MS6]